MEKYFNIKADGNLVRCKIYYNNLKDIDTAVIFGHGFGEHKDNKAAERFAMRVLKKNQSVAVGRDMAMIHIINSHWKNAVIICV